MDVSVYNIIWSAVSQDAPEPPRVREYSSRMRAPNHASPERNGLFFVVISPIVVHEEVEMKSIGIEISKNMHQPCLDAGSVKPTYDLKDLSWAMRLYD